MLQEFSGGLVVETPGFVAEEPDLIPSWELKS